MYQIKMKVDELEIYQDQRFILNTLLIAAKNHKSVLMYYQRADKSKELIEFKPDTIFRSSSGDARIMLAGSDVLRGCYAGCPIGSVIAIQLHRVLEFTELEKAMARFQDEISLWVVNPEEYTVWHDEDDSNMSGPAFRAQKAGSPMCLYINARWEDYEDYSKPLEFDILWN